MSASVEVCEEFIRNQISKPTADPTIVRSWWRYAYESGYFDMPASHAPGFCRNAKQAGKNINEEFGFESKPSRDQTNKEAIDDQSASFNNIKPSRTQRAINAKSNRLNDNKVQDSSDDQKARKENFTSDGIEALKPFESSLSGKKTQSS